MLSLKDSDFLTENFDLAIEVHRGVSAMKERGILNEKTFFEQGYLQLSFDIPELSASANLLERIGAITTGTIINDLIYSSYIFSICNKKFEDFFKINNLSLIGINGLNAPAKENLESNLYVISDDSLWSAEKVLEEESFEIGKKCYSLKKIVIISALECSYKDDLYCLIASELNSIGIRVLDILSKYLEERKQFGKKLSSFQTIRHILAELNLIQEQAQALNRVAVWSKENLNLQFAHAAKSSIIFAPKNIKQIAEKAIQLFGGIGFSWEHEMHYHLRRICYLENVIKVISV